MKECEGKDCSYKWSRACNWHCKSHPNHREETPEEAKATAEWVEKEFERVVRANTDINGNIAGTKVSARTGE